VALRPKATIKDGEAYASVTAAEVEAAIADAKERNADTITVIPEINGTVKKTHIEFETGSIGKIYEAKLQLAFETSNGNMSFDSAALGTIKTDAAGVKVEFSIGELAEIDGRPAFELLVMSGGIAITDFKGGKVTISLPYTLKSGEKAEKLAVNRVAEDGTKSAITPTTYDAVNKLITFVLTRFSKYVIDYDDDDWVNPFTDVNEDDWFYEAVKYVNKRGLMIGKDSLTTFKPNDVHTRAEWVMVLARMSEVPATKLDSDPWYAKVWEWAMDEAVTDGTNPTNAISREQVATMLWRLKGKPESSYDYSQLVGADVISDWAEDAMRWATETGIIIGDDNGIRPKDSITRAEVATILMRYLEKQ
jgi:hypothetical protein